MKVQKYLFLSYLEKNESGNEGRTLQSSLVKADLNARIYMLLKTSACITHRSGDNSTGGLECADSNIQVLFHGT